MEKRYRFCQKMAYIGLGILIMVYLSSWILGDSGDGQLWLALRVLLVASIAMTVAGVLLGLYYKGKSGKKRLRR
jgi:magnesium-transporting ATPase (P-type)